MHVELASPHRAHKHVQFLIATIYYRRTLTQGQPPLCGAGKRSRERRAELATRSASPVCSCRSGHSGRNTGRRAAVEYHCNTLYIKHCAPTLCCVSRDLVSSRLLVLVVLRIKRALIEHVTQSGEVVSKVNLALYLIVSRTSKDDLPLSKLLGFLIVTARTGRAKQAPSRPPRSR